jgi:alpha-tubulin suppressor-like RCC1 family protein
MGDALPVVDVGLVEPVNVVAGTFGNCVRLDDGSIKCWGYKRRDASGDGGYKHRGDNPGEMGTNLPTVDLGAGRTVESVDAGWTHTCAVLDDKSLKCWGDNSFGQLGLEDLHARGNNADGMGNKLPRVKLFSADW